MTILIIALIVVFGVGVVWGVGFEQMMQVRRDHDK